MLPEEPSRRKFLAGAGAVALATLAAPAIARATPSGSVGYDRLWITRSDTGETLNHPFAFRDPRLHRKAWASFSFFWRDVKDDGQAVWMDPRLLVVLAQVQVASSRHRGEETPLMLNSGFRTVRRNATIEGAAPNSLHCRGCAGDLWAPRIAHRDLRHIAAQIPGIGGLGGYSSFTHIDTGPARRWGSAVGL
jgi:uncharacterized protein YcbK (DUF882 family)